MLSSNNEAVALKNLTWSQNNNFITELQVGNFIRIKTVENSYENATPSIWNYLSLKWMYLALRRREHEINRL